MSAHAPSRHLPSKHHTAKHHTAKHQVGTVLSWWMFEEAAAPSVDGNPANGNDLTVWNNGAQGSEFIQGANSFHATSFVGARCLYANLSSNFPGKAVLATYTGNGTTDLDFSGSTITRDGGSFITDGFGEGRLTISGSGLNDGTQQEVGVGGVAASVLTLSSAVTAETNTAATLTQTSTTAFTIGGWVKWDAITTFGQLLRTNSNQFIFGFDGSDVFGLQIRGFSSGRAVTNELLVADRWYHIVGRWDGGNDLVEIFVDSVLQTDTGIGATIPANVADDLQFGANDGGFLDEWFVEDVALSDGQIENIYLSGLLGERGEVVRRHNKPNFGHNNVNLRHNNDSLRHNDFTLKHK